jgi:heme-degrading monooxygenase HmoA
MLVKVYMRRKIKRDKIRNVFELIRKIRANAMNQHGYISGETLVDYNDPQEILVIGTWQSGEDWKNWKENPVRKELELQLEEFLEEPTTYKQYIYSKHYLGITKDTTLG